MSFRMVKIKDQEVMILDLTLEKVEWRIEHEARGIYVGFDHNSDNKFVPKFRYSILRTDPEAWVTRDARQAEKEILKVMSHAPKAYLIKMLRSRH